MASLDFYQAPASKAIFYGSGLGTVVSAILFKSSWIGYDVTAFAGVRLHRVLANQLVFGSVGEMILGLGLIYQFRLFERRMGTARFVSFSLLSTLLSVSLQMLFLIAYPGFESQTLTRVAPGPYSFVFALFVQYFAFVPKLNKHRFLGAEFSEKTFVYIWGSQLLLARGRESALAGICGFLGGLVCLSEKLPFRRLQLPDPVSAFGKNYLAPLFASRSPSEIAEERMRQQRDRLTRAGVLGQGLYAQGLGEGPGGAAGQQGERLIAEPGQLFGGAGQFFGGARGGPAGAAPARVPQLEEPSEEQISTLTALGFSRGQALGALRAHGNNVERAADSLLSGG